MNLKERIEEMAFEFENEDGTFKNSTIFLADLFEIPEIKQLLIHSVGSNEVKLKFNEFANKQQDLDSEFVKIVNDNFWDLI